MRFAYQQLVLMVLSLGPLMVPEFLEKLGVIEHKPIYPETIQILLSMAFGAWLIRFLCWLSWGSERGLRFQRLVGINPEVVLHSIGSPLYRWWFHIDKNGKDLDAPR